MCPQVALADHVQGRLRDTSLSGIQLDWDRVESSLRTSSLGASSALAMQLQGIGSFTRTVSRSRRATDSTLMLGAQSSDVSRIALKAMARAGRERRATEDNVLLDRIGSTISGPFSPSDDEEDRHSEQITADVRSASGLSRSFSTRRRRATDSEILLPELGSIQERISGGPAGTIVRGPDPQGSAGLRVDAEEEEEEAKEVIKGLQNRSVRAVRGDVWQVKLPL